MWAPAAAVALLILVSCQSSRSPVTDPIEANPVATRSPTVAGSDGSACETGNDCQSRICEGSCGGRGVCQPTGRACEGHAIVFCPCEGDAFWTSSACPGHRGVPRDPPGACPQRAHGLLADDAACDFSAQCQSGSCTGGCGVGEGRCARNDLICGDAFSAWCSCDGAPYTSADTCPKQRGPSRRSPSCAPVPATLADGDVCELGAQCISGTCEGGCGRGEATCRPAHQRCARDQRLHTRCDGTTFEASSTCPGVRTREAATRQRRALSDTSQPGD